MAVPTDEGARQQLVAETRDKSLDALTAIGDVSALPDDVVEELIGVVESEITRQISEARQGAYGFGAHDVGARAPRGMIGCSVGRSKLISKIVGVCR